MTAATWAGTQRLRVEVIADRAVQLRGEGFADRDLVGSRRVRRAAGDDAGPVDDGAQLLVDRGDGRQLGRVRKADREPLDDRDRLDPRKAFDGAQLLRGRRAEAGDDLLGCRATRRLEAGECRARPPGPRDRGEDDAAGHPDEKREGHDASPPPAQVASGQHPHGTHVSRLRSGTAARPPGAIRPHGVETATVTGCIGCRPALRGKEPNTPAKGVVTTPMVAPAQPWARLDDPGRSVFPVLFAEKALEHLAVGLARELVDELDPRRHLEVREVRAAVLLQLLGVTALRTSTTAMSCSPSRSSGTPNTAQSTTAGCV